MKFKILLVIASIALFSSRVRCQEDVPVEVDPAGAADLPVTDAPEVIVEPEVVTEPAVVIEVDTTPPVVVEEQVTPVDLPTEPTTVESILTEITIAEETDLVESTPAPTELVAETTIAVIDETITDETTATTPADDLELGVVETTPTPETTTKISIVALPVTEEGSEVVNAPVVEEVTTSTTTATSTTVAGFVPIIGASPFQSIRAKTDLVDEPEALPDVEDAVVDETTTVLVLPVVIAAETTTKKASPVLIGTEEEAAGKVWVPGTSWSSTPSPVIPITDASASLASRWEGFRSWVYQWGLLLFGLLLLLLIILVMIYACCCMKTAFTPIIKERIDIERNDRLRPVDLLRKSDKSYQEELSSGTAVVQSYRETTQTIRETGHGASSLGAGTPNNSFAIAPNTRSSGIENQNFQNQSNNSAGYKFISPRHLDSGLITHSPTPPPTYADRRLEVPSTRPSSRDVIAASRAPTAIGSEAPSVPISRTLERDTSLERERPVLRGGSADRSSSPRPFSVHRTTLLITPSVNRDSSEAYSPAEQNSGLTYSDYVGMIRGEPSDFGQYSPDRRPLPVHSSSGRHIRDSNTESQV